MNKDNKKLKISRAIVVEGRDDVDAVSKACEALIIPTHGYGIAAETWAVIEKAYNELGIIILTDPDSAGERIRKRLTERFPQAVQCYLDKRDARSGDDIGIENASPEAITEALEKALANSEKISAGKEVTDPVTAGDLISLGLSGGAGSSELRAEVCRSLGIGYCNARSMITKLKGFGIGKDELKEKVIRIKEEQNI
jgi:ribonuclease M5